MKHPAGRAAAAAVVMKTGEATRRVIRSSVLQSSQALAAQPTVDHKKYAKPSKRIFLNL